MIRIRFTSLFLLVCICSAFISLATAYDDDDDDFHVIRPVETVGGFVEDVGYSAIAAGIIASGKTEEYAQCFVTILKLEGTTGTVSKFSNIFHPEKMLEELENKFRIASWICSYPIIAAILMVILFLFACCACCKCLKFMCCWCCCDKSPNQIQIIIPSKGSMRQHKHDDKVELISQNSPPCYIDVMPKE